MPTYSVLGTQMISKALLFATAAHEATNQKRKYTGDPYIEHPKAVADIVSCVHNHTWQMVAAALLHDVIEDTHVRYETIGEIFGPDVTRLVLWLTNVRNERGNRAQRLELNIQRLRNSSWQAQTIKCADIYHNLKGLVQLDPHYAAFYVPEKKRVMVEALGGGDQILWGMTMQLITDMEFELAVIEQGKENARRAV
jgi:(p)ppGpp synthase/HD superfamily hydrolase